MLASVLDRLTAIGGRKLLVGAYFPVLLFISALAIAVYLQVGTVRLIRVWNGFGDLKPAAGFVFFLMSITLAYLMQISTPWLSRTLHGANWPRPLVTWLTNRRANSWSEMLRKRDEAVNELAQWEDDSDMENLHDAFRVALAAMPGTVDGNAERKAAAILQDIRRLKLSSFKPPMAERILKAKADAFSLIAAGLDPQTAHALVDTISKAIETIANRLQIEYATLHSAFVSRFGKRGHQPVAVATELGALFAGADRYAEDRYGIDGAAIWPRLEKVISADFRNRLEDAQLAYSFVIITIWLCLAFFVLWWVLPITLTPNGDVSIAWAAFGVVPLLMAALLYFGVARAAAATYCSIYQSCFDLFRFELLAALHHRLPASLADEQEIWRDIGRLIRYGENPAANWYAHPPAAKT